jgi:hypothetical protein
VLVHFQVLPVAQAEGALMALVQAPVQGALNGL